MGFRVPGCVRRYLGTWNDVPLGPRDPILGISEAFKADPSPLKINLGVGAYRDDKGKPFVLECVQRAEALLPTIYKEKEYLDIAGLQEFNDCAKGLAYVGEDKNASVDLSTIATCQSLSGTGALRLAGVFLERFAKNKLILCPNPTWGNHHNIFRDSGLTLGTYRYWNPKSNGLDLPGMLEDIKNAPKESIILLHACAHNPTGVDPTPAQWEEIKEVIKNQQHVVLFDMAYQGFASGSIDRDAFALRSFQKDNVPLMLCQSFAKNFGLYGERIGAFSIPCKDNAQYEAVLSQIKIIARPMYSNPPIHGARLVATILKHDELRSLWFSEVKAMADRIISMRSSLRFELEALGSNHNWNHITEQIGMFCYTGLNAQQVARLTQQYHVYLTKDGRISMAGIHSQNVKHLAEAMHQVTKN